jgi:hypothetical protein
MKRTFLGALIGAVLLAVAAPAGAATVTGTSIINAGGSVSAGDPALNFAVTNFGNSADGDIGAQGINGADFDNGKRYYDYIFSFTLNTAADITTSAAATAGTHVAEGHAALFNTTPSGTALNVGHNPGPLTGLISTTGLLDEASNSGNGALNTLSVANLAAGTYYLRLFGVINGNSDINSLLTGLSGTFVAVAATPIPAALPLFGTALGLFGVLGWRRKAAAAV